MINFIANVKRLKKKNKKQKKKKKIFNYYCFF